MGYNTESMIKSAICETITEELFRELGFYVLKLGQENILNPITQLQHFIYKCSGKFQLTKFKKDCISSIDYVRKLPDFLIVHKDGEVLFLEVKFRYNGHYEPDNIFDIFPSTKVLVIQKVQKNSDEELDDPLFNIYEKEESEEVSDKSEGLIKMSLEEWLLKKWDNRCLSGSRPNVGTTNSFIISKYEELVRKWIIVTRDG